MEDSQERFEQRGKGSNHSTGFLWKQHNAVYNSTLNRIIRSQSGMTVIELLIALSVMVVVINMTILISQKIGTNMLRRNSSNRQHDIVHGISTQMTLDLLRTTKIRFNEHQGLKLMLSDGREVTYEFDNNTLSRNRISMNPGILKLKKVEFVFLGTDYIQSVILGRSSIQGISASQISLVDYNICTLDDLCKVRSAVFLRNSQYDSSEDGY